jgi:MFS family permease
VLLGGYQRGSFALGGIMAAAHAFGEAAFAPWLGRRLDRRPVAPELRRGLAAEAVLFGAMAVVAGFAPAWTLVAAAFFAGGSASGVPGGMRALMVSWVPAAARHSAMSLESVLGEAVWVTGPALAALVGTTLKPQAGILIMAVSATVPAILAPRVRGTSRGALRRDLTAPPLRRVLVTTLPALFLSAAVLYLVGALDITLPPRLHQIGASAALSGPMLSGFAGASILGGLLYGARSWPGSHHTHGVVLLLGMAALILPVAVLTSPPWIAVFLIAAGTLVAPVLTARNLVLQQQLPQEAWSSGFSALYACGGVGYGISGSAVAALLGNGGAALAIIVSAISVSLIAIAATLAETLQNRTALAPVASAVKEDARR